MEKFTSALGVIGGVLLLLGNAFFVVTEFAMTRVRQFSEKEFQKPGLRRAWEMTEKLEIYLSGCQVGITICSVGLGVVAEPALAALIEPIVRQVGLGTVSVHAIAVTIALVIINLLHVAVGEQAPTYLGIERTKTIARYLVPALYWWTTIMGPVIYLADKTAKGLLRLGGIEITRSWTEEEEEGEEGDKAKHLTSISALRSEMGKVLGQGALSRERRQEVMSALEIEQMPVRNIMVPHDEMVALSATDDLDANLERMRTHPFDRFPLVGTSQDDFCGTVYLSAVFRDLDKLQSGEKQLQDIAHAPMIIAAETAVSTLIDEFQDEDQELALVHEKGEVVGLVTTTDAFEAIAGELEDPVRK